jgi:hypothetical protein
MHWSWSLPCPALRATCLTRGPAAGRGGHHFLSENINNPSNNGAIYNEASIIKSLMSSAVVAEIGVLYINAQKGVEERNILEEMGHLQPPLLSTQII